MDKYKQEEFDLFLCESEAYELDMLIYAKLHNINIKKISKKLEKEAANELPY